MHPSLAVTPALASLIARSHDMARLAKWRLDRCVFDIVTFDACQSGFYAVISDHQPF